MWATGVQRDIPFGFVVDVSYVGRKGRYLQREVNINQLLPGTIQANPGGSAKSRDWICVLTQPRSLNR